MAAVKKWAINWDFPWTTSQIWFGIVVAMTWCPYLAVRFFGDRYAFVTAGRMVPPGSGCFPAHHYYFGLRFAAVGIGWDLYSSRPSSLLG